MVDLLCRTKLAFEDPNNPAVQNIATSYHLPQIVRYLENAPLLVDYVPAVVRVRIRAGRRQPPLADSHHAHLVQHEPLRVVQHGQVGQYQRALPLQELDQIEL